MKLLLDEFYAFLDRPLKKVARLFLALLVIPLGLHYTAPLWNIHLKAAQYPKGLDLYIYSYKLMGGHEGKDIPEINTLNHYIGMKHLDPNAFPDLDWMPFALGLLIILTLRVAVIGNIRMLLDLTVIAGYVSLFAFGRFWYMMYQYGHNLSPDAPFKIEPFTPVLFGEKQLANFTTRSFPELGTYYIAVFIAGLVAITIWHLLSGRRAAVKSMNSERVPKKPAVRAAA